MKKNFFKFFAYIIHNYLAKIKQFKRNKLFYYNSLSNVMYELINSIILLLIGFKGFSILLYEKRLCRHMPESAGICSA